MADDVAELIDRLESSVPHSSGDCMADSLRTTSPRKPELVCGVVLGDANPEVTADRASQALAAVSSLPQAFACTRMPPGSTKRVWDCLPTGRATTSRVISNRRQVADTAGGMTSTLCVESRLPRSRDLIGTCWLTALPALILRGQRGEIRPQTADRMLAVIPQARAQTIYGASHDVFPGTGIGANAGSESSCFYSAWTADKPDHRQAPPCALANTWPGPEMS